jgi:glycerol-3-phosphate dehydrogenase
MAEEATDVALEALRAAGVETPFKPCETRTRPLPGGGPAEPVEGARAADVAAHLGTAYGARADLVAAVAGTSPLLEQRIVPTLPYVWAEVVHAVRSEEARDLADVLVRRVPIFRDATDQGLGIAEQAAALVGAELGWDDGRRARAVAAYAETVRLSRSWKSEL